MSPSGQDERDLRAALHDGEGASPNVDHIVFAARAVRSRRRSQLLSGAAAAVVVAGIAVGIGFGTGSDSGVASSGSGAQRSVAGSADGTYNGTQPGRRRSNAVSGPDLSGSLPSDATAAAGANSASSTACPSTFPRQLTPGGGGTGEFGAHGKLFARSVTRVIACTYPEYAVGRGPEETVLTGAAAASLVASLEGASTQPPGTLCPTYRRADQAEIAFIGVTAGGTMLTPVTTTLNEPACQVRVTNGTAIRYGWTPPAAVAKLLPSVGGEARSPRAGGGPPRANGSPASS